MNNWTLTINGYDFVIANVDCAQLVIACEVSRPNSKTWDYQNPEFIKAWNKITTDWEEIKSIHMMLLSSSMWVQIYEEEDDPVGKVFQIMNSEYASEEVKALARSVLTLDSGRTYRRKSSKRSQN